MAKSVHRQCICVFACVCSQPIHIKKKMWAEMLNKALTPQPQSLRNYRPAMHLPFIFLILECSICALAHPTAEHTVSISACLHVFHLFFHSSLMTCNCPVTALLQRRWWIQQTQHANGKAWKILTVATDMQLEFCKLLVLHNMVKIVSENKPHLPASTAFLPYA